jgi:hypothetical protein
MIETSFPRAALNDSLENVYYDKKKKGGGGGSPCLRPLLVCIQGLGTPFSKIVVLANSVRWIQLSHLRLKTLSLNSSSLPHHPTLKIGQPGHYSSLQRIPHPPGSLPPPPYPRYAPSSRILSRPTRANHVEGRAQPWAGGAREG